MPWNPNVYNQFKSVRFLPFFDLSAMIQETTPMKSIDLGCGTGEQTALLVQKFEQATFVGIDASQEMLEKAYPLSSDRLIFTQDTIEAFASTNESWDLIFSNAALQWSDDHQTLFPKLIKKLNPGGQFAVQMPCQAENVLNQLVDNLADTAPFKEQLGGWNRKTTVLSLDDYAQLLFEAGLTDLQLSQRIYPLIAETPDSLYSFIAGSALIPYMERLNEEDQALFIEAFKEKITTAFPTFPALYAFKRILLYGRKEQEVI